MSGQPRYTWRKLATAKWEDAWVERLRWLSDRLAITALAGAKTIRIEAFALTRTQAGLLKKGFGGVIALQKKDWSQAENPPYSLRVGGFHGVALE